MSNDLASIADRPAQVTRKQMVAKDSLAITMWKERIFALRREAWKIITVIKEQGSRTAVHQGVSADKGEEYKEADCWRIAAPFPVCPKNKGKWTMATSPSGWRSVFVARFR
jgi:hypothetical protein